MPPTLANGKICYLEIPPVNIQRSADFYAKVFGWRIRQRSDGRLAFDDGAGEVSGTWVLGRKASAEPGLHRSDGWPSTMPSNMSFHFQSLAACRTGRQELP